mmetsp:Transcript_16641/g.40593  ORF Transcript_16641/g.40593 Transcript_16641/m.40593 type:complete len:250 (-) Transcript_16641:514-1263(-)
MAPKISQHQLLQELEDNNEFFDNLVDMIPAKLYVAGNSGDNYNPKYFKGQAKESKEARRAQNKQAKRAKLDPSLSETTTQVKKRLDGGRSVLPSTPATAATKPKNTKKSQKNDEDVTSAPPPASADPSKMDKNSRIEALRAKLHAKLAEKRGQRPSDPNVVSKRAARRAEKLKRKEEAKARKKISYLQGRKFQDQGIQCPRQHQECSGCCRRSGSDGLWTLGWIEYQHDRELLQGQQVIGQHEQDQELA